MSDYHEASLDRYLKDLERQYKEEYERANNPEVSWFIITPDWEEWAETEEEKKKLIQSAKDDGLRYSCTQHIKKESY